MAATTKARPSTDLTLTKRGGEQTTRGFISRPFNERPIYHAFDDEHERGSRCGPARATQSFPLEHLMWFARPCSQCWDFSDENVQMASAVEV